MLKAIRDFAKTENGATAAEYAILIGLIAAVIIGAVQTLGSTLGLFFLNAAPLFGS